MIPYSLLEPLVIGQRDGGNAAHHADDRHEHRACVLEQHRAADHERGDAAERGQGMPIPSHNMNGQSRLYPEN
jgi:hypothetical protein